jgi:hypothetical protein
MDVFRAIYPTVCEVLVGTSFESDAKAAVEYFKSKDDMKTALDGRMFGLNELMWLLCGAVVQDWASSEADQLERDLATIVRTVGIDIARTTYKQKFLVEANSRVKDANAKALDAKNKLEDLKYEIAVTARACAVLDAGSIQLEKPIPDANKEKKDWKNSDVFGKFQGHPVRIEVTVLHESLPPAIHMELDELVRQADVSSGFQINLRSMLEDHGYAERVRALVELLHEHHLDSGGRNIEIDGVRFEWKGGGYHCSQKTSPLESICFYAANELADAEKLRDIIHPCAVRNVTPRYVLEDNPNPPGVITSADLPDAPTQVPVSTKIYQMLDGKRQQCEEGHINIVAFGNPLPMNDREVSSAVLGPAVFTVPYTTDENGVRHFGEGGWRRESKAPFVPAMYLADEDDRATFVEPFERMSAVWHIRLGSYASSSVISNPNALNVVPQELQAAFSDPAPSAIPEDTVRVSNNPKNRQGQRLKYVSDASCDNDLTLKYVDSFTTIDEAIAELEKITNLGHSLEVLQKRVDQLWSEPPRESKQTKFISPTKEEMAMTFVIACGGYEEARARLEAYAEKKRCKSNYEDGTQI